ncbi:MAG: hypothetical protein MZU91_12565 [Desulfosudis oleivorans]|nr:hypothetical protein [Desulfosudis oleivorans]
MALPLILLLNFGADEAGRLLAEHLLAGRAGGGHRRAGGQLHPAWSRPSRATARRDAGAPIDGLVGRGHLRHRPGGGGLDAGLPGAVRALPARAGAGEPAVPRADPGGDGHRAHQPGRGADGDADAHGAAAGRRRGAPGHGSGWFERLFDRVTAGYGRPARRGLLDHRLAVLGRLRGRCWPAGGCAMSLLGSEFLPQMDDGRIMVKVKLPHRRVAGRDRPRAGRHRAPDRRRPKRIETIYRDGRRQGCGHHHLRDRQRGRARPAAGAAEAAQHQHGRPTSQQLRPLVAKVAAPGGKVTVVADEGQGHAQAGRCRHRGQDQGPGHGHALRPGAPDRADDERR